MTVLYTSTSSIMDVLLSHTFFFKLHKSDKRTDNILHFQIDDASAKEIVPSVDTEALDEMVARRDEQIAATKEKVWT